MKHLRFYGSRTPCAIKNSRLWGICCHYMSVYGKRSTSEKKMRNYRLIASSLVLLFAAGGSFANDETNQSRARTAAEKATLLKYPKAKFISTNELAFSPVIQSGTTGAVVARPGVSHRSCDLLEQNECFPEEEQWYSMDFGWYDSMGGFYDISVSVRLPEVEMTLPRQPMTVCMGGHCQSYTDVPVFSREGFAGMGYDLEAQILDVAAAQPAAVTPACSPAVSSENAKNTTSQSSETERMVAANEIINQTVQGPTRLGLHNKPVKVIYSDGGSETINFNAYTSAQTPKQPSDLKQGNGVSRCPSN